MDQNENIEQDCGCTDVLSIDGFSRLAGGYINMPVRIKWNGKAWCLLFFCKSCKDETRQETVLHLQKTMLPSTFELKLIEG